MKTILYLLLLIAITSCNGQEQEPPKEVNFLSISPTFEKSEKENEKVIHLLERFLKTKNNSPAENDYWLANDFEKYGYPYQDIYNIEKSKYGDDFFRPTLMELVAIDENKKLVKVGFVGVHPETEEIFIKCIYNMIAVKMDGGWKLKKAIEYLRKDWQVLQEESITYYLPPHKNPNQTEINTQKADIKNLCQFFKTDAINITYYSSNTPKQMFELKGFDYLPNMYYSTTGGMIDYGGVVYSGNNSEYYTHEIAHIYTRELFPSIHRLLDEGIATYIGGSGKNNYIWHRNNLKQFLDANPVNLSDHLDPYERFYVDNETPIPYMIGALICERAKRIYGNDKLFELFRSSGALWEILQRVGLTKDNLTVELKNELKLAPMTYLQ